MKTLLRILVWIGILLIILIAGLFISGYFLYNKKYEAPYPDIHASTDSSVIAHGRHLVFATAHCVECHFQPKDSLKVLNGEEVALSGGGFPFKFPGGKFYAPNISNDKETGIGNYTDGEIARAMRHQVKRDGSALIPAMEFQKMSDADITAIISYLRTVPAVNYKVPENDFNLFGKAIIAFFIKPEGPSVAPPKDVKPDTTIEYGSYIANALSNCRGCHTQRDMNTGKYIGEELAGGPAEPVPGQPDIMLVAPNLTPDSETGHLRDWDFERFKNRFSQGSLIKESIMPWGIFKNLNETELLAIWKYLHSVKPVKKDNGPPLQKIKT